MSPLPTSTSHPACPYQLEKKTIRPDLQSSPPQTSLLFWMRTISMVSCPVRARCLAVPPLKMTTLLVTSFNPIHWMDRGGQFPPRCNGNKEAIASTSLVPLLPGVGNSGCTESMSLLTYRSCANPCPTAITRCFLYQTLRRPMIAFALENYQCFGVA